jgi:hypothetical protein
VLLIGIGICSHSNAICVVFVVVVVVVLIRLVLRLVCCSSCRVSLSVVVGVPVVVRSRIIEIGIVSRGSCVTCCWLECRNIVFARVLAYEVVWLLVCTYILWVLGE